MSLIYNELMELENRFSQIKALLLKHQPLFEKEALNYYGDELNLNPSYAPWLESLFHLSGCEKLELENYLEGPALPQDYKELLKDIKSLCSFEQASYLSKSIPKELKRKFSKKKEHEISLILSQIESTPNLNKIESFIDIGSGAGHLSSALLYNNTKSSNCLDMSSEFQNIGRIKLQRYYPEILNRLTFKVVSINSSTQICEKANSLILGLHACGDLSVHTLKLSLKTHSSLLNYTCCYHKLSPQHLNLSKVAKSAPLMLTTEAKNLAAKSFKIMTKADDIKREKVKRYRYALFIFIKDHLHQDIIGVGNGHSSDYALPFSIYAKKFSSLTEDFSHELLNDFYHSKQTQRKIDDLLNLGVIRSHFARLIECYIIIDRALYLKENGCKVKIEEVFNRALSPRNLALISVPPHFSTP